MKCADSQNSNNSIFVKYTKHIDEYSIDANVRLFIERMNNLKDIKIGIIIMANKGSMESCDTIINLIKRRLPNAIIQN